MLKEVNGLVEVVCLCVQWLRHGSAEGYGIDCLLLIFIINCVITEYWWLWEFLGWWAMELLWLVAHINLLQATNNILSGIEFSSIHVIIELPCPPDYLRRKRSGENSIRAVIDSTYFTLSSAAFPYMNIAQRWRVFPSSWIHASMHLKAGGTVDINSADHPGDCYWPLHFLVQMEFNY